MEYYARGREFDPGAAQTLRTFNKTKALKQKAKTSLKRTESNGMAILNDDQ
jgi:hypothetical protein